MVLLDDRGWSASGPPDIWARTSREGITATARTVVGPDEPTDGDSNEQAAADHWAHLSRQLRRQGLAVEPDVLAALAHDVEIGEALQGRLAEAIMH